QYIEFERDIFFAHDFIRKIGSTILEIINKDFRWNLFFKIIFEIEEGNNCEDFEKFMIFIRYRFSENIELILREKDIEEAEKEKVKNCIMENIADNLCIEKDVDFLSDCNINTLNDKIKQKFKHINNYQDWINNKEVITNMILNHKLC